MTLLLLPRLLARLSLIVALLVVVVSSGAAVRAENLSPADDDVAWTLMRQLENNFRRETRVVRIQFTTNYTGKNRKPLQRTIWGVVNGDTSDTRLLYVVTEPARMNGTTLLFADKADTAAPDSTWLYLSAVKRVRLLDIRSARAMVPGTALTYEDSRGFVPVDKYRLKLAEHKDTATDADVVIMAEPLTDEIRAGVGFDALVLRIDPEKKLLQKIDYLNDQSDVFKTYRLEESVKIGEVWFPARMTVRNDLNRAVTEARYTYWPLAEAPPDALFDSDLKGGLFISRLQKLLLQAGIDSLSIGSTNTRSGR